MIELVGGTVPANWDGVSCAAALRQQTEAGRDHLVLSHAAMTAQRSIRFDDWICVRTYHDGYKLLDPILLFNLREDPHERNNLAAEHPAIVDHALGLLAEWQAAMFAAGSQDVDPMITVLKEGGPFHSRGRLPAYLERLRSSGRAHLAEKLAAR